MGLAYVREEPGIGGTAPRIRSACLSETQMTVDGQANLMGVGVFLAIVFPPAHRAQLHGCGRLQRSGAAAGTAKADLGRFRAGGELHNRIDGFSTAPLTSSIERLSRALPSILYCGRKKGDWILCGDSLQLSLNTSIVDWLGWPSRWCPFLCRANKRKVRCA